MTYDLTILVPVYNEEKSLPLLLKKLAAIKLERRLQVIIVNDGSTDKSADIIKKWAKQKYTFSVESVTHPKNKGKGAGIQTGLAHAKGKYFVIQDGDLEYNPADIPKLLEGALQEDAPVVYGSRFLGSIKTMPTANYLANRFYNLLIQILYGVKMTDMHTCYKMIRTDLFKSLNIHSQGFGYAPEVISKLLRIKTPVMELPISYRGRSVKDGKKINVRDGFECLGQLLKYRFQNKKKLFAKR